MKKFGTPPPPPLSTNPPIPEQFFHDPPISPNFKNEIPPLILGRGGGGHWMVRLFKVFGVLSCKIGDVHVLSHCGLKLTGDFF